jgi:hypothetical protein
MTQPKTPELSMGGVVGTVAEPADTPTALPQSLRDAFPPVPATQAPPFNITMSDDLRPVTSSPVLDTMREDLSARAAALRETAIAAIKEAGLDPDLAAQVADHVDYDAVTSGTDATASMPAETPSGAVSWSTLEKSYLTSATTAVLIDVNNLDAYSRITDLQNSGQISAAFHESWQVLSENNADPELVSKIEEMFREKGLSTSFFVAPDNEIIEEAPTMQVEPLSTKTEASSNGLHANSEPSRETHLPEVTSQTIARRMMGMDGITIPNDRSSFASQIDADNNAAAGLTTEPAAPPAQAGFDVSRWLGDVIDIVFGSPAKAAESSPATNTDRPPEQQQSIMELSGGAP